MTHSRKLFLITGTDVRPFLQGLITNDINKLDDGPVYAAMLTPQGKYSADFLLSARGADIILDVDGALADGLAKRLMMYKLRSDVAIAPLAEHVHRGLGACPDDGFCDPRHKALGWRAYRKTAQNPAQTVDWEGIRVRHLIPESGIELTPDSYILEAGFERLNGVDFRKGCYVGQEITARMKHKTELKKGLVQLAISGAAPTGHEILSNGKPAGTLFTQSAGMALAHMRFDRIAPDMQAGDARLSPIPD